MDVKGLALHLVHCRHYLESLRNYFAKTLAKQSHPPQRNVLAGGAQSDATEASVWLLLRFHSNWAALFRLIIISRLWSSRVSMCVEGYGTAK